MRLNPLRRAVVAISLLVLVLAACGGGSSTEPTQPSGQTTTSSGQTTTTEAARFPEGAMTDLPDGFPADEIPLFGEVLRGSGTVESGIWIIVTRAEGSTDDARSGAEQALIDGGFEKDTDSGIFESDPYKVVVQTAPEGGGTVMISYSIATTFTR